MAGPLDAQPPIWRLMDAAEIRRRGDARRRRRRTMSTLGVTAVAAAVVVMTSTALRAPGGPVTDRSLDAAEGPPVADSASAIPAGFPLGDGLVPAPPGAVTVGDGAATIPIRICGQGWRPAEGRQVADGRVTGWRNGATQDVRVLLLFSSAREAQDAFDEASALAERCTGPSATRSSASTFTTVDVPFGRQSMGIAERSGTAHSAVVDDTVIVTRADNALLAARTALPTSRARLFVNTPDGLRTRLGEVAQAMCTLTGDACSRGGSPQP